MRVLESVVLGALAAAAFGSAPAAQFNGTVGPNPVAVGCEVQITVSIDHEFLGSTTGCPFRVLDADLVPIFTPDCAEVSILMLPGGWHVNTWDQRDDQGQQVPPGNYWVEVSYDIKPPTLHPLRIAPNLAGMVQHGTPRIGTNRPFYLCSPQDGGELYFLLGAITTQPGIPTCNGAIPLAADVLFSLSLTPNTLFQGSLGVLDASGRTLAPSFAVPNDPGLIGVSLAASYFTLDLGQVCPVLRVSPAYALVIV